MKRIASIIACVLITFTLQAQQKHFVYIQTENKQPFSVRVGDRILSSSGSGYVVIPKLTSGKYDLNIGFPKNEWPNQHVQINVDGDMGFVLKNFENKGWGLFNIQTMSVVMNDNSGNVTTAKTGSGDGFADALADVVGSPSIKTQPKQVASADTKNVETKNESGELRVFDSTSVATTTVTSEPKTVSTTNTQKTDSGTIVFRAPEKISSFLDQSGRSAIYVDTSNGSNDTIRIFIPYPQGLFAEEKKQTPVQDAVSLKTDTIKQESEIFTRATVDTPDATAVTKTEPSVEDVKYKVAIVNSDCKSNASESDFLKLRSRMAAQKSEENMVIMAQKDFRKKCFTTEQVANLSILLSTDKGRYTFFDAAYPHVSDTGNFGMLASRLTDEYYKNRFLAMIRR
jgi:hypothetical protein